MTFQGIIFDFNGVLLWDNDLHERAWNAMSRQLRGQPFTEREFAERVHGRTNRQILNYLLQRPVTAEESERLAEEKERLYRAACLLPPERMHLSPGAESLLAWLAEQDVRRTIATSSAAVNMRFYLEHLPLARWFDTDRILYDDGNRPGKPAPDIYLDAAAAVDLPPAACVVVEDAPSGIRAAAAAGIGHVIALGPADLAKLEGVDSVISRLDRAPRSLWNGATGAWPDSENGAGDPDWPRTGEAWRSAIKQDLGWTAQGVREALEREQFPYAALAQWIRRTYNPAHGYAPPFAPALLRNLRGLIAWVFGDASEPYWPGSDVDHAASG